ncbi:MAG: hypothetical protein ACI9XP_001067 [Lentimonas sp.]|jgi:hypothetical protein
MLDKWLKGNIHSKIHLFGICLLAAGLPFSKALMSIGVIWGIANLLLEGKFKDYFFRIKSNKLVLLLLGVFALHFIALIWTNNWDYALDDIRKKLPLFALPVALVAKPITERKSIHLIFLVFLISLILCSVYNVGLYHSFWGDLRPGDYRGISAFGSHIRFSTLIIIGACISFYFGIKSDKKHFQAIAITLVLWFLYYTYISQVLSGVLSLIGAILMGYFYIIRKNKGLFYSSISIVLAIPLVLVLWFNSATNQLPKKPKVLEYFTQDGNDYQHELDKNDIENGEYILLYYCDKELQVEWEKISDVGYYKADKKGQALRKTLFRYMTSLHLRKDRRGFEKLSAKDINNIENGIASVFLSDGGIESRLYEVEYQINNRVDPNGHSFLQRLEYWKTSFQIIANNWFFGVGTGDIQDEFDKQYDINNSNLLPENRHRAHNMFLTVWATFGLTGILLFLAFLYRFLKENFQQQEWLALLIFGAIVISFTIEDTLETQTGVSLFALFFGVFLAKKSETKSPS